MKRSIPCSTVRIGPIRVPLLLYADDIVLLAESRLELQHMLSVLEAFCSRNELVVNLSKSAAMVLEPRGRDTPVAVCYLGREMPVVQEYRYLGVVFS